MRNKPTGGNYSAFIIQHSALFFIYKENRNLPNAISAND